MFTIDEAVAMVKQGTIWKVAVSMLTEQDFMRLCEAKNDSLDILNAHIEPERKRMNRNVKDTLEAAGWDEQADHINHFTQYLTVCANERTVFERTVTPLRDAHIHRIATAFVTILADTGKGE